LYEIARADIEVAYLVIESTLPKIANAEVFGIKGYGHQIITAKWPRPMPTEGGNGA
jgi:hypothetical protein